MCRPMDISRSQSWSHTDSLCPQEHAWSLFNNNPSFCMSNIYLTSSSQHSPAARLCNISLDSQLSCIYTAAQMAATTAVKQQQDSNALDSHHGGGYAMTPRVHQERFSVMHPFQSQAQYGPMLVICKIELLALVLARRQPLQMMKAYHLGRVSGTVHLPLH